MALRPLGLFLDPSGPRIDLASGGALNSSLIELFRSGRHVRTVTFDRYAWRMSPDELPGELEKSDSSLPSRWPPWPLFLSGGGLFFAALGVAVVVIHQVGAPAERAASFGLARGAVLDGDWWRILTSPLVHGSNRHLLVDLLGLALVWIGFSRLHGVWEWLLAWLASCLGSALGTIFLGTAVFLSVGLSGPLHGLLVVGAAEEVRRGVRSAGVLLLALVAGKIALEQSGGGLTSGLLGRQVDVDAHLGGALFGAGFWVVLCLARAVRASKTVDTSSNHRQSN